MERKADLEYKQLVKIGVPENMAYLIVNHKYNLDKDAVDDIINDVKDQQLEIKTELENFLTLKENLELVEKEKNKNLISNDIINKDDKN